MSKPKPSEKLIPFSIKVPESLAGEVDDLVSASSPPNRTAYVIALLTEAVELRRVLKPAAPVFEDTAVTAGNKKARPEQRGLNRAGE